MPGKRSPRATPDELALIEEIRRRERAAPGAVRIGIGDDCAVLQPKPGHEICVTTDFSLENVHFRREWHPPQSVGHRCLARGLSDLAAMGAEPLAVFLSLALPARLPAGWLDGFLDGFLALAKRHRVPLAGGDTAQSPGPILADIVAIGQVLKGHARLRSAAKAGDFLYVTGALGGAAAELNTLSRHPRRFRALTHAEPDRPHLYPEPRVSVGLRLRDRIHACIDISDGLSTDLTHLCHASGLAARIDQAALPIHPLAAGLPGKRTAVLRSGFDLALHGGEDYELLFTAPPSARIPRTLAGVTIHRVGTMHQAVPNQPLIAMKMWDGLSVAVQPAGWQHFAARGKADS